MDNKLSLDIPFRTAIVKILDFPPANPGIFGRTSEKDYFFQDLLTVGFDFYELLELFINCDAVTKHSVACIVDNVPEVEIIQKVSEKDLRTMIPHWSASRYHTASIEEVCRELKELIENKTYGIFVYNSNSGGKTRRTYNDTYVLILTDSDRLFFDINRKKTFRIGNDRKGDEE